MLTEHFKTGNRNVHKAPHFYAGYMKFHWYLKREKKKHDKGQSGHNCLLQLPLCSTIFQQCTINYKDNAISSGKAFKWNLRPPFLILIKAQKIYKWKPKEKVGNKLTIWNLYNKWFGIIHCPPKPTPKNVACCLAEMGEVLRRISIAKGHSESWRNSQGFP